MAKAIAGQVVKQTMYIHLCGYTEDGVILYSSDMSKMKDSMCMHVCLGSVEVEYTVPEHNETKLQVEALENHLQTLNAEHHLKTQNIKDQIQRLLAIGHDSHDGEVV